MRTILGLCVAIAAVLGVSQDASAAFSFRLAPASANAIIGGPSQTLSVFAESDTGPAVFTLSAPTVVTVTPNPNITFGSFVANPGGPQYLANAAGTLIGTISYSASPAAVNGSTATVRFSGFATYDFGAPFASGTFQSGTATITAVPEPSSFALLGLSGLGYVIYRKRRAAKS